MKAMTKPTDQAKAAARMYQLAQAIGRELASGVAGREAGEALAGSHRRIGEGLRGGAVSEQLHEAITTLESATAKLKTVAE